MKFAIIDGNRTEAVKGAKGICPNCESEVIAKCGEFKQPHWSHKAIRNCDPWWENETEWHRNWKNNFPIGWQEVVKYDEQTGEKHIADICTNYSLVVEFQHSHINPQERVKREAFYKPMIWIVDGTRLKRDYPRFRKGIDDFQLVKEGVFKVSFHEEYFSASWLNSKVPVIFDFRGSEIISKFDDFRNSLYCLFPILIGGSAIVAEISRSSFINTVTNGEWQKRVDNFINEIKQVNQEYQRQQAMRQEESRGVAFQKFMKYSFNRRGRRF